jgi:hypothetical protein
VLCAASSRIMVMGIARLGACSRSDDVARVFKGVPHRPRDRVEISAATFSLSSLVGSAVRHLPGSWLPVEQFFLLLRNYVPDKWAGEPAAGSPATLPGPAPPAKWDMA